MRTSRAGWLYEVRAFLFEVRGRSVLPAFSPNVIAERRYFGWFTGFQTGYNCWTPVVRAVYRLSVRT
ncbi:hypothetical protein [Jeotgalibaca porci]|uniref:hypothetical protein n=1 Tax=Jeotgalibaca porci TaxID=1868793 RepID=UPI00359F9A29